VGGFVEYLKERGLLRERGRRLEFDEGVWRRFVGRVEEHLRGLYGEGVPPQLERLREALRSVHGKEPREAEGTVRDALVELAGKGRFSGPLRVALAVLHAGAPRDYDEVFQEVIEYFMRLENAGEGEEIEVEIEEAIPVVRKFKDILDRLVERLEEGDRSPLERALEGDWEGMLEALRVKPSYELRHYTEKGRRKLLEEIRRAVEEGKSGTYVSRWHAKRIRELARR